ncbi:Dyp-type peroxidase [Arsenicicoccus dermatophilus]|uniref:Dyp-type peroxidase n=1 Tax=Arsenicicoccus dermatophilus TaxID=1076331 RepID=UPI001F4CD968|nr:Dyp-type peroxidase [Arsenicicoccus dermatophilus]MCH8614347.1 Dyp-type peroxidase [Arsenicicoccus dermatophilus]
MSADGSPNGPDDAARDSSGGAAGSAPGPAVSRRGLLAAGASALGGVAVGAAATAGVDRSTPAAPGAAAGDAAQEGTDAQPAAMPLGGDKRREFWGEHQPGIIDPPQAHGVWVALDLVPGADVTAFQRLMRIWTQDISQMMSGTAPFTDFEPEMTRTTASLSVTLGIGPRVFALRGVTQPRPPWLGPLPAFPAIDKLQDRWSGGDLLLQICADSPITVSHAQWVLTKEARTIATVRWVQRGFRQGYAVTPPGETMRNLFGQVDGTVNPRRGVDDSILWCGSDAPRWLQGGTTMVLRRIAMHLDTWEEADPVTRDTSLGRRQHDGSPLTGKAERDAPDLDAKDKLGLPVIDDFAHVRRSMPHRADRTDRFLRRPFNYDDPPEPGQLSNAGLLFIAYQSQLAQFVEVQRRLAEGDLLNTWTTPIGSSVWAIPRGCRQGELLAQDLWV